MIIALVAMKNQDLYGPCTVTKKSWYARNVVTLLNMKNNFVFYVDGDLTNQRMTNIKTVCANCQRILQKEGVRWRQGDLVPDF